MNFFEHQESARRRTRLMLVLYLLAVVAVVVAVDVVIAVAWAWSNLAVIVMQPGVPGWAGALASVPARVHALGILGTLAVILGASVVQTLKLGAGGTAVAEMMGARRVGTKAADLLERRLLNVVEEMSLASGVRVPAVFVMDQEPGINAFAAGNSVSNAAIVVTRGTLESLNRDELQGVIGHEFSHIMNGDMALNVRMLGILAGIVFIGSVGRFMLRSLRGSRNNKGAGGIALLGLALFVIGSVGLFFARLIKASVSRQREFLADASSVQFTRNPDGIAGALDQIRASGRGTEMDNRYAEDVAHMFFGQGIRVWLGGVFDTHPPIEERIRRVHPRFQPGAYRTRRPLPETSDAVGAIPESGVPAGAVGLASGGVAPGARATDLGVTWGRSAADSMALVGQLDATKMEGARRQLAALPPGLCERLHDPSGACAALVALLLAPRDEVMAQQLAAVRAALAAGADSMADEAARLAPEMQQLGPTYQLAIVDLALPSVKAAGAEQQKGLLLAMEAVIHADRRVSLNEFVMLTLVKTQLTSSRGYQAPRHMALGDVRDAALLLIGLCALAGGRPGAQAAVAAEASAFAFRAGARVLGFESAVMPARDALALPALSAALDTLRDLAPLPKAILVKALFATVTADGTIRVIEAALLRMVGAALDCPLPPLLADIDPAALAP